MIRTVNYEYLLVKITQRDTDTPKLHVRAFYVVKKHTSSYDLKSNTTITDNSPTGKKHVFPRQSTQKTWNKNATGNQLRTRYSCAEFDLLAEYFAKNLRVPRFYVEAGE